MRKTVIIVGGGISGLAAAYRLQSKARGSVDFQIVEASPRLGGKIRSDYEQGFVVEGGPDSFLPRKRAVLNLCHSLGLQEELMAANSGGIFVLTKGHLVPMPDGLMMMAPTKVLSFLKSPLISWPGKIRMSLEALIPQRVSREDESLASFVRRRLGQEALDKIAGPLFAGIYSGDPETLSLHSTFPFFAEMERKHGSLIRGFLRQKQEPSQGARTSFLTLKGGLQTLVDSLVRQLPAKAVMTGAGVQSVARLGERFQVKLQDNRLLETDALLLATPTYVTAEVLKNFDPSLAERLKAIRYASTATVSLAFKRTDIPHSLNGTGFIVPQQENRKITACTWSSQKFNQRAPEGFVLLRVFMGGLRSPELAGLPEQELVKIALDELRMTMQITANPVLAKAYRWQNASPQYEVGHAARVSEIEKLAGQHRGLHLAGAAYHGAGVPDCIQSGMDAAEKILQELTVEDEEGALCAARMETQ